MRVMRQCCEFTVSENNGNFSLFLLFFRSIASLVAGDWDCRRDHSPRYCRFRWRGHRDEEEEEEIAETEARAGAIDARSVNAFFN